MSFSIDVDTSQLDTVMQNLLEKLGGISEIIATYCDESVIPALQAGAGSARHIRTGTYEGSWEVEQNGKEVDISTEAYYWIFLEYGTSRGIKPKPVVAPVVDIIVKELPGYIVQELTLNE